MKTHRLSHVKGQFASVVFHWVSFSCLELETSTTTPELKEELGLPFPGHALRSSPAGRPVRGEPRALARAAICTARLHTYDRRLQYAPALAWLSLSGIDPCEACGSFVGCCLPLLLCLDCLDCLGLALCPRLWPAADVSRVHVCSQWRTMSS